MAMREAADKARTKLLNLEKRRQTAVVLQFGKISDRLKAKIEDLLIQIEHERRTLGNASQNLIAEKVRLNELLDAVTDEIHTASRRLAELTRQSQTTAIEVAKDQVKAYPRIAAQTGFFDGEAVKELIGIAGDGKPLERVFRRLAKPVRQAMFDALFFGISSGASSATIAAEVRNAIGGGTAAAMTIVRTETNRAYREASRKSYVEAAESPGGPIGWRWIGALDFRMCIICWQNHGRVFKLKTKFGSHPNCRCTMIPVFDKNEKFVTGPEIFAKFNGTQQKAILGPKRYELYLKGAELKDFVMNVKTPFGIGRRIKPLVDTTYKPNPRTPIEPAPPVTGGAVPFQRSWTGDNL